MGWGSSSVDGVTKQLREVLAVEVEPDGLVFDLDSVVGQEIRSQAVYVGVRVLFSADLGGMALRMQVDVGFGDAVVPEPRWIDYPQLLDLGRPRLLGYPVEATLAEKLHAVVELGLTNSRMKDYYDLWAAQTLGITTPGALGAAIRHTFARRETAVPRELPEGLTSAFAGDVAKQTQWRAFVRKSKLSAPSLSDVMDAAVTLAAPAFEVARSPETA